MAQHKLLKRLKHHYLHPAGAGWDRLGWRYLYATSKLKARAYDKAFASVQNYCWFLGYPRSGHTLVGSLLDAHPEIIIAQELHALKYVDKGFSKNQLFYLCLKRSEDFTKAGRIWSGYDYNIPNQWNGRFRELKVIGDKKGGASAGTLMRHPHLVSKLVETLHMPMRVIHVVRNPYDNITTIKRRAAERLDRLGVDRESMSIEDAIKMYFKFSKTIQAVKQEIPSQDMYDLRHEDLIANPKQTVADLCRFLGVEPTDDYLTDCASIVYASPNKSRNSFNWTPEQIQIVADEIAKYPFLKGYTFDS